MPTIGVEKEDFLRRTGMAKSVTQLELEHLFFDLGLELDDIEEENGKVCFQPQISAIFLVENREIEDSRES